MPLVEGLTRGEVAKIVAYSRQLQKVNGIDLAKLKHEGGNEA